MNLEVIKANSRTDDFSEDDEFLTFLTEAAEEHVSKECHRSLDELLAMGPNGDTLPLAIQQAISMLVAHWYNQRETGASVNFTEVPYTFQALVKPYRKFVF